MRIWNKSTFDDKNSRWFQKIRPYLILALAPLCWAGNIVLARGVADIIPPISFAFWRWTVAIIILLPFTWAHLRRDWPRVMKSRKILILLSMLGLAVFNTLLYTAVHTTTAINGALIQTVMPAIIILFTLLYFHERIARIQVVGVSLCIFGACVVVLRGTWTTLLDQSFVSGDFIMLAAVVLYALYSALLRKRPPIHPLSFLTVTAMIACLILLPLYLLELAWSKPFELSAKVLLSLLYVGVFPSIVAYFCWNLGVELIGANQAGLFINLIPIFASILAILFLDETLQAFHIVGMILVFCGMVLFSRESHP
jgi:drug/metabolite transporter (DMT)-like permease